MIKTIKVKKNVQLRLDELIKYIFDNGIKDKGFRIYDEFEDERYLTVNQQGMIRLGFGFYPEDTFTVEVEEEITKDTVFEWLASVNSNGNLGRYKVATINEVLEGDSADCFATKIYALIDTNLEQIWEADSE